MTIRLKSDELVAHAQRAAHVALLSLGPTVDDQAAARLEPFLHSVWESERARAQGPVDTQVLRAAHDAAVMAAVHAAAGVGRSAVWVSRDEATKLPDGLRQTWVSAMRAKQDRVAYAQALHEPFPLGKVDPELFFDRHLAMIHKRAADELFDASKLLGRLPALEAEVQATGAVTLGDITVYAAAGTDEFEHDGKRFWAHGSASTLVFVRADAAVAVGWKADPAGVLEPQLRMLRYGIEDHEREPRAATSYAPPGSTLEELVAKLAVKTGLSAPAKHSEDEALYKRFSSVDVEGLQIVALAAVRSAGAGVVAEKRVTTVASRALAKDALLIPELAARADFIGVYRRLADHVAKYGEIVIGDLDGTVRIADRFERYPYGSEEDAPAMVTLVAGKGPMLVVDNSFGGLGHAVPLAALEIGELDVYLAQRSSPRGRLHRAVDGSSEASPDPVIAQRLTADLLEFLPATLEDAQR